MITTNSQILEEIIEIKELTSIEECNLLIKNICSNFGIEKFALAIFYGEKNLSENFSIYHTYPKEWIERYNTNKYYQYDPVFNVITKAALPFVWHIETFKDILPSQKKVLSEAHDFGVDTGTTIPLIPHRNFHGFITILEQRFLHPEIIYVISFAANMCVAKIVEITNHADLSMLTAKEILILEMKSKGVTNKKLVNELGICLGTLNFYLANIRKKLNTISTEQSLLKFVNTNK